MDGPGLARALSEWEALLGAMHVVRESGALRAASTATFATRGQVQAILRPANREDVQQCVQIANRCRVPIYPVSSGRNWGYGSRVPVEDGVLIDLARLNRILELDEELAYVTIEPGVTQRQLQEFLRQRNSRLWMDATGASPECSVVGNTLERGFGHTPMGDHCGNACALEVVLPTGDCVRTGFGRFAATRAGALGRWGLGPSLDGLLSQSNLGIVTRMSVWLMPEPECFQAFFFVSNEEQGLGAIVDALRPLRLNGTLRSVIHIGNDYKVLAATSQFPWADMHGRTPLDQAAMARLRRTLSIGAWNGSGGLYGTRAQVREARAQLRRALRGKVDRLQFVDDRLLKVMQRFARPFRVLSGWDVSRTLKLIAPVYGLLKGVPTESALKSVYWRKKTEIPDDMDPDRDGCGLLWCSPVLPNTGADVTNLTNVVTNLLLEHGFEPQMTVSLATERSAICVITISYDRSAPGEDERAGECYRALMEVLVERGYPPYRLNVSSMGYMTGDASYARALEAIKSALDPNGILAPGRYEPARAGQDAHIPPAVVPTVR
ncbi:MAG: FAD-binding oxidoreductase [Acidobacteria bacterium]|nr:FAD-binding oxidoreductase [Acidobacteriota bacterium]